MKNYLDIKLDVISIAQAKEILTNPSKNHEFINHKQRSAIKNVLEYISDSLKHIPNERRKQIRLGDYLERN